VQSALGAFVAAGLPPWAAREAVAAQESAGAQPKGEPIRLGHVGIGSPFSRGRDIFHEAARQSIHKVQSRAVCDVDHNHLGRAVTEAQNAGFHEVTAYHDFRDLNDRRDLDAVFVATPDHWHALVAIDAMTKGKDVYCEKPLTLTIEEALAMKRIAEATGRIVATGNQQRSDPRFRLACELIRNGRIGKVQSIEARIGANPTSDELPKKPIPTGFDYNFWLGPCPEADFVEDGKKTRCHYEFRWWYEYSGGKMTDWGAHHLDIAQWALGKDGTAPTRVEVLRSVAPLEGPNRYNTHPEFHVQFTYPEGTRLIAMHGGGTGPHKLCDKDGNLPKNRKGDEWEVGPDENGVLFHGDEGKLFVSRSVLLASDPKILAEPLSGSAMRLEVSPGHMVNFLNCVRDRKQPICHVGIGVSSVIVCHLGTIALRLNKALSWDPVRNRFDDEAANAMLSRPMRAPWKLVA